MAQNDTKDGGSYRCEHPENARVLEVGPGGEPMAVRCDVCGEHL